jgi:hypothetical protein
MVGCSSHRVWLHEKTIAYGCTLKPSPLWLHATAIDCAGKSHRLWLRVKRIVWLIAEKNVISTSLWQSSWCGYKKRPKWVHHFGLNVAACYRELKQFVFLFACDGKPQLHRVRLGRTERMKQVLAQRRLRPDSTATLQQVRRQDSLR